MGCIRFHEAERLFKAWPLLEAILESLKVDWIIAQNKAKNKENLASEDDYILSMVFGNKSLDSIPPKGKVSDTTGNIAVNIEKIMNQDVKRYAEEWKEYAEEVGEECIMIITVLDKLNIAFRNLTKLQQDILRLFYWEGKVWKEVRASINTNRNYKSESALKAERDKAIDKMAVILSNSMDYKIYERIMQMVESKK